MNFTKILGVVAAAALALMAFASTASATTLEIKGVKQTSVNAYELTLKSGTSLLQTDTSGFFANTCTTSTIKAKDSTKTTGSSVEGPVETLSWGASLTTPCTEGNPTVDALGALSFEWIKGTTNATVKFKSAKWTVPSPFGLLTCTTSAEGTDLGTLTGAASGRAIVDFAAVLACGITAKWTGTYTVTTPEGLGVVE